MKKILGIILFMIAFAIGADADVKPFVFDGVDDQKQYDYMLQYKLYGYEYLKIGRNDVISDKSGWSGSAKSIEMGDQVTLGGPILAGTTVKVGNGAQLTTGPVRATSFTMANDNNSTFAGNWCIANGVDQNTTNIIKRSKGAVSCDKVPEAPTGLKVPTLTFPDTTKTDIKVNDRQKVYVDIPDVPAYDMYVNSITTGTEDTLFIRLKNKGTLTRIFVKGAINLGNHTVIQAVYDSLGTERVIDQKQFRGNLLFYTQENFNLVNSDKDQGKLQGTFISAKKIYWKCNIDFAGQLLANELEIGDEFDGKHFRFVKFNSDTIDVKLDKYGGLKENDSTVVIPIELSDTATITVYFSYCIDLKNGVTLDDFNIPPSFPLCSKNEMKSAIIDIGDTVPNVPIQINVKWDTIPEPEDYIILKIDSIYGAILPNGETSGDLKIKIVDADLKKLAFDSSAYKMSFEENKAGFVDTIRVQNGSDMLRYSLDSAFAGRYTLDPITGVLTLVDHELDYETAKVDYIVVTITDSADAIVTDTLPIKVIDVNEKPEIFNTTFKLWENTPAPKIIGTITWNEVDGYPFNEDKIKVIKSSTDLIKIDENGVISTNTVFDYETSEHEYLFTVVVYDVNQPDLKDTAYITVDIGDINEIPTVGKKKFEIVENTEPGIIGNLDVKDPENAKLTYTVVDPVPFKVDTAGNIVSTRKFDYEHDTYFKFKVEIDDGLNIITETVTVNIIDVDEPVHAKDTTFSINENTTGILGTVIGEDEDGKAVKYSVDDFVHYNIDSVTGALSVIVPLDYETVKQDTVLVFVTDGVFKDTAKVVVNVGDVNEPPVLKPNDSLSVPENCKKCIIGTIVAVDPDTDKVTYDVIQPGFAIDTAGVLTTTEPFDYEKTPEIKITVIATDPSGLGDTAIYTVKITDVNEPVHVNDTTCSVKENYTGKVCQIPATDEDKTKPIYILPDTTNYKIDTNGTLIIKKPIDYEKKTKDTVKVIVTDGEFSDTATVVIRVLDEPETVNITKWDEKTPPDTVKTNEPDHKIDWEICEGDTCSKYSDFPHIKKDTVIKVCNEKKTVCDSIVVLFNDAPPVVILSDAKSTDAYIDYITIVEPKDDKIYVNKKENPVTVTVKDTVRKTEKHFEVTVKLDTIATKDIKLKDYHYLIDVTVASSTNIGGGLVELREVINVDGREVVLTEIVDKDGKQKDTVQTISYNQKVNGKEVTVSYKVDNLTGNRVSDYTVAYKVDSCTSISYGVNDKKKIVKNNEGNVAYTITYDYVDDYGNKASASIDIVYDDIPPKVKILLPTGLEHFNTNAIPVKWTVNDETQDTLTLQRLEKGVNYIIRRYVDKAGNVAADTVTVLMNEAKDIDIEIINPVTKVDQDKVDEYYSEGHKYNDKKPFDVKFVDPKNDTIPDVIGVGFKVDIVLPSVSPIGNISNLSDIVKNDKVPVDDKGNVVGASNLNIPVEEYINENCTDDFKQDYHKNGVNIPLYNVKYNLHLWIYTSNANYVNDFEISYDIDAKTKANNAGIANFVIDWIPEKDGNIKAKNQHSLGTGAYLVKLYSKSTAIYRCGFKNQKAGDKITKKEYNLKSFGYKRPNK